jgi:hypothetical protein
MSHPSCEIVAVRRKSVIETSAVWLAIQLLLACLGMLGVLVTITLAIVGIG